MQEALSRPWAHLRMMDGHLIPQHYFVGRKIALFRYEEDWGAQIAQRFGVKMEFRDNVSPDDQDALSEDWMSIAHRLYRKDFKRFGYNAGA